MYILFDTFLLIKIHLIFQGKPLIDNKQSLIEELQKKIKKLESQLEKKADGVEVKPVKEKVHEECTDMFKVVMD